MAEQDDLASPAHAWRQGGAALRDGEPATARLWLERALRLAPDDPRISFDLATVFVALGTPDDLAAAIRIFTGLAARHDVAAAWLGLMTATRLANQPQAAAAALASLLARHCLPADPQFAVAAGMIADGAGAAGWCGLSAAGLLRVQAMPGVRLAFAVDGKPLRLRPSADGFLAPPAALLAGALLTVSAAGTALLGSPLALAALRRVEGVADCGAEWVFGWASRPALPMQPPALLLVDARGVRRKLTFDGMLPADGDNPFLPRHQFICPTAALRRLTPPFRICPPDGRQILGSPLDPAIMAIPPVPAARRGRAITTVPPRRRLSVVVPVYRGLAITRDCLHALFAAVPGDTTIIVVDDATPEPELAAWLDQLAAGKRIQLRRHPANLGFPAAANTGFVAAGRRDVLLLNSDTLVPPGAITALVEAAYSRAEIGSVTPLSNQATILNYPDPAGGNPAPDLTGAIRLNQLALRANGGLTVALPTGVGFCMLLRHDCLAATGHFRGEIFAQGYGEENDWCLRARQLGYTHVAAAGAYVAHVGGVSFKSAGQALNQRNATRLNLLYPGYHEMIMAAIAADPLAAARRKIDALRLAEGRAAAGAVLLISHNHGGGVARLVAAAMAAIRAAGRRPLLLFPAAPADPLNTPFPWASQLTDGAAGDYPNLRFTLPAELPALLRLLRPERIERVELHHALGHHPAVHDLAARLGVAQDIVIHDYASFCPRVNLLTRPAPAAALRYCGEPNIAGCIDCIERNGDETFEGIGVARTIARSAAAFAAARRITAPSPDAAQRIARHFPGIKPVVTPWEDDDLAVRLRPPPAAGRRKIVVIGGIGPAKGFDILIDCANDAARRDLRLDFIVAGAASEDSKLLATGRIFVTGAYQESAATALIRSLGADLAFLPSIWPETWCFTLSEAWRAGLYAIAFDLGAPAARIRATGRGGLLPLGLPISRINDTLLAWQPDLRNSQAANRVTI